jgi:type II restriction enzyme
MTGALAAAYHSSAQRARVVTEAWGEKNLFCPNCSSPKLTWLEPGHPASDYSCPACGFWYQLKSQKSRIGDSITDGAYAAMMNAIRHDELPSFYFMQYAIVSPSPPSPTGERARGEVVRIKSPRPDPRPAQSRGEGMLWLVRNLLLVPHFAFPPSAIIKRKPLSPTARRAGWIGCNFALNRIPADARIPVVTESRISPAAEVRAQFKKVKPFKEIPVERRGWMLDVLNIVRQLGKSEFTNQDVYAFESRFKELHPNNNFIRDKIRQQLQDLARAGFLIHAGRNDWQLKLDIRTVN